MLEEEDNPFVGMGDPLCKLNLKETSEFVKSSFPMSSSTTNTNTSSSSSSSSSSSARRRRGESSASASVSVSVGFHNQSSQKRFFETPSTPGRPVFGFSAARRSIPSKWDDAEKWLINTTSSSPPPQYSLINELHQQQPRVVSSPQIDGCEVFDEKLRVTQEKVVSKVVHQGCGLASEVFLKGHLELLFPFHHILLHVI